MTWYEIFPRILNMSLTASVIICFVLLCRLLLKRAPKIYSYVLWSVVLFRLLCPVSLSAPVSILKIFDVPVIESTADKTKAEVVKTSTMEYIPSNIVHEEYPEVALPVPVVGDAISEAVNEKLPQGWVQTTFDPLEAPITIATYIWMFGILCWLSYGMVTYFRLRQRLVGAMQLRSNIYLTDHIQSPFVMGILRPRIYLPSDLDKQEQRYIILHEKHHIRRGDPVVKMLAFITLCIHWFNPLVWIAFLMSAKDMEMSCDEAVVKKLGEDIRADYSTSLLQFATGQRILFGTPLAFGEGEPAGRIRNLARYKRPTIVVTTLAVFACAVGILLCVFNPASSYDSLQMTEQETTAGGNLVRYEVNFGLQVGSAGIAAEHWIDGTCVSSAPVTLPRNVEELQIQMKERKNGGTLSGIDIQIDTGGVGGSLLTYFPFTEGHTVTGWAFTAYEEHEKLRVNPEEEKILAAMVFDEGNGVRVFDCETLIREQERLLSADRMIVIRASFHEEVVEESRIEEVIEEIATEEVKGEPDTDQSGGSHTEESERGSVEENYFAQWELIAKQKDMWVTYMDYANDLQQYTVTDMDGNGRLEVIVSSMGGTGSFTYTRFYEVNESFDGLTECTTDFVEGDSQPDVLSTNEPGQVFRDPEGTLHYVIRDFMRVGTEYYNITYDVVLKNGHITHSVLTRMHDSYSSGNSVVEYTNAAGEKITEAEYLSAAENAFTGMSELIYVFDWRNLEEIANSDEEDIYTILSGIRSGIVRGNEMMEEVPESSWFQSDEATVEAWMKHFGAELNENIYYVKALENLQIGRLLPDGREAM